MKKVAFIFGFLCCLFIIDSCEIDNYQAPDAQIYGGIYDSQTNELIQQDIINGALIEYKELGWENGQFQYMIFKQDGTYRNNLMFAADYTIRPASGNFVVPEVQNITVEGETKVDFFVQPFLRVKECSIVKIGNEVIASFKLEQTLEGSVSSVALFASKEPSLGASYYQANAVVNVSAPADPVTLYTVKINLDNVNTVLIPGEMYYFRAGALFNSPGAKYNYAPAVRIGI
jgi:hypothetical protein